jgi:putative ABC transport system permease protein
MRLLDLRVAARQLRADPFNASVLILCLALALAASYLLAVMLGERYRPDPALHEPERIVMLDFHGNMPGRQEDWFLGAPFALHEALQKSRAPLQHLSRSSNDWLTLRVGERQQRSAVLALDASAVELFGLRSLQGDLKACLSRPDTIVLRQSLARQLFGERPALGQLLHAGKHMLSVCALLADPGSQSTLREPAFIGFDSPAAELDEEMRSAWFQITGRIYGRLAPGASAAQVGALAQALLDASPIMKQLPPDWTADGRKAAFMRALPITRLPFEGREGRLRVQALWALGGVAVLLLSLALLNFINLSSVRTVQRQREIAVRKSLGLGPLRLLLQFAAEAQLSIALAAALAVLLAWLMVPWLAGVLQLPVPDSLLQALPLLGLAAGCTLLGGLVCLYPAWLAWRQNAAAALQGRQASEGASGRWLRRTLTVLQFGVALLVCSLALILSLQNRHVLARDLGFDPHGVLALRMPDGASPALAEDLRQALAQRPEVQALAWSDSVPGSGRIEREGGFLRADLGSDGGEARKLRVVHVDADFFTLYRIPLLAGQLRTGEQDTVVLDLPALRALGWARAEQAVGQDLRLAYTGLAQRQQSWRIAAVVPQLVLESTRQPSQPHAFALKRSEQVLATGRGAWVLNLRLREGEPASLARAEALIAPIWKRYVPDQALQLEAVEAAMQEPYRADLRLAELVTASSVLALALAGFGVYALAAFLVQRHARELVLRKLYGASAGQALTRLLREFAGLLLIAALLALPLSWWLGQSYLSQFADRAAMGLWPQALALLGLLLVSLIASLHHGLQAMAMRSVLALKS